jgi:hypothetical protein
VCPCDHNPFAPLYRLRYSPDLAHLIVDIQGKTHHRPCRTLWPTDCNTSAMYLLTLPLRRPLHCPTLILIIPLLLSLCLLTTRRSTLLFWPLPTVPSYHWTGEPTLALLVNLCSHPLWHTPLVVPPSLVLRASLHT